MEPPGAPPPLDPSASLHSSVDYFPDGFDHLLNHNTSPLVPLPEVSYTTLMACLVVFRILSKLDDGGRLNVMADGKLEKYGKPTWKITRWWQSLQRWWNEQNTQNDLNVVETLTQNAIKCLENPSVLETAVGYGEKIFLLYKLKKYVHRTLTITYPAYLKTCSTGESNSVEVNPVILENNTKRANEVKETIDKLSKAINTRIERLETFNQESHEHCCQHFLDLFCAKQASLSGHQFPQGLPDRVLASAVKKTLTPIFGESLVQEMLKQYRLQHLGMLRIQDLLALLIGLLAQSRLQDNPQSLDLSNSRQMAPTGVTTPLKRYQRLFERDKALLLAHQSARQYSKGHEWVNGMFPFAYIEREVLDLATPFMRYPECPLLDSIVYETVEGRSSKVYEMCSLRAGQRIVALALVHRDRAYSPTLRLIITQGEEQGINAQEIGNQLRGLAQKTLAVSADKRIAIEICVPPLESKHPFLSPILNELLLNKELPISQLNIQIWGPTPFSPEAGQSLNKLLERWKGTVPVHLRYFLYRGQVFTVPAIPTLGFHAPASFSLSLFYFKRDREYPSQFNKRVKRYFAIKDEGNNDNQTFLCGLYSNHHEDLRQQVREEGHWKLVASSSFNSIRAILMPPPPPPGYLQWIGDTVWSYIPNIPKWN